MIYMKQISANQNDALNLNRLAAQRYLYSRAKHVSYAQVLVLTIGPIIAAVGTARYEEFRPWGALVSLVTIALGGYFLELWRCRIRERAAMIQEVFDCAVLDLPWNAILASHRPTEEVVHEAAIKARRASEECLRNWYPHVVDRLPLHQARIICQRINCSWDNQLRIKYQWWIWILFAILCLSVVAIGMACGLSTNELVLGAVTPVSPTLLWVIREARLQKSAAEATRCLQAHFNTILEQAVRNDISASEATDQSRELQNQILLYRKQYPPVPDWIYRRSSKINEQAMKATTEELVNRFNA